MQNMKDSPSIPQRVLVEQESGSDVLISTPAWLSLAKKAGKNDVPLTVLEQVYARGLVEAKPHPKNTPEQQAFHRVDSFIHEGKAYELDSDLTEALPVPDGRKHMPIIKSAIKNHQERMKRQRIDEHRYGLVGSLISALAGKKKTIKGTKVPKSEEEEAQELAARQARKERVKNRAAQISNKMITKKHSKKTAAAPPPQKPRPPTHAAAAAHQANLEALARAAKRPPLPKKLRGAEAFKKQIERIHATGGTTSFDKPTPEQEEKRKKRFHSQFVKGAFNKSQSQK